MRAPMAPAIASAYAWEGTLMVRLYSSKLTCRTTDHDQPKTHTFPRRRWLPQQRKLFNPLVTTANLYVL